MGAKMILDVPMGAGLSQRTATPHLSLGDFAKAQNVRQNKNLSLSKRPGNVKLTKQYQQLYNIGPANLDVSKGGALFSYNDDQLLIATNAGVACYSNAFGTFGTFKPGNEAELRRSPSPMPSVTVAATSRLYSMEPAVITDGTYYFWVFIDSSKNLWTTVQEIATGAIIQDRAPIDAGAGNILWAVPLLIGGQYTVVYLNGSGAIKMVGMNAPYAGLFTISLTLVASGVGTACNIDAVTLNDGLHFSLAYSVGTANGTVARVAATSGAISANIATAAAANIQEIRLSYESKGTLWLAYRISAGNFYVEARDPTSMALTMTGRFQLSALGVTNFHLVSYATNQCVVAWTQHSSPSYLLEAALFDASLSAGAGGVVIAAASDAAAHSFLASKPFLQDGRVYCWAQVYNDNGSTPLASSYGSTTYVQFSNVLVDLRIDTGTTGTVRPVRPVAIDAPRFAFPKPNAVTADAGLNLGVTIAPLSICSPATNKWVAPFGVKLSLYATAWDSVQADFAATSRWASARLGTLGMLSSGLLLHWDGVRSFENGFVSRIVSGSAVGAGAGGSMTAGATYYYRVVPMALDIAGNIHRGAPSELSAVTLGGGDTQCTLTIPTFQVTDRIFADGSTVAFAYSTYFEIYRSKGGATSGGTDIATNLVDIVANSPSGVSVSYTDTQADTVIAKNAYCYTFGGQLPNVIPPAALHLVVHQGRAWVLSDEGTVWYYTKQIVDGEGVNFCDQFTFPADVPCVGGASMDDKLIMFGEREIYYLVGHGPNDDGTGTDYDVLERIQSDVGCIDRRSICAIPAGILFQSHLGIYLLTRALEIVYIGAPIVDELATYPVVTSAVLHPREQWVYITVTSADGLTGERLVYDYRVQKWYTDTLPAVAISATRVGSDYYWLDSTGQVWQESTSVKSDNAQYVESKLQTAPLKPGQNLMGYGAFKMAQMLYSRSSMCDIVVTTTLDYSTTREEQTQIFWDKELDQFHENELDQLGIITRQEQLEAIQITITDRLPVNPADGSVAPAVDDDGSGVTYFGLSLLLEGPDGLYQLPDSQVEG